MLIPLPLINTDVTITDLIDGGDVNKFHGGNLRMECVYDDLMSIPFYSEMDKHLPLTSVLFTSGSGDVAFRVDTNVN
jgi:hypothetical protein